MTIAAGEVVVLVNRPVPKNALSALMAGKALGVLPRYRRETLVRKADDRRQVTGILYVRGTRSVTGFATPRFDGVARVESEYGGMDRVRPISSFLSMTAFAGLLPDIGAIALIRI